MKSTFAIALLTAGIEAVQIGDNLPYEHEHRETVPINVVEQFEETRFRDVPVTVYDNILETDYEYQTHLKSTLAPRTEYDIVTETLIDQVPRTVIDRIPRTEYREVPVHSTDIIQK